MPRLSPSACDKRLAQRDAAILHRVMRVHLQIALALQLQVHDRMLGEQRQHVVEKRDAGFDRGLSRAVNVQFDGDAGFFRDPFNFGAPIWHTGLLLNNLRWKTTPKRGEMK